MPAPYKRSDFPAGAEFDLTPAQHDETIDYIIASRARANHTGTQTISTVSGLTSYLPIRPEEYGSVGDGAADDTTALGLALAAGIASGRTVRLDGRYRITSNVTGTSYTSGILHVTGTGTIYLDSAAITTAIHVIAAYPTAVSVTGVTSMTRVFPNATSATTASAITAPGHGCVIGDVIKIVADDQIPGSASANKRVGEFAFIGDVVGDVLYVVRLHETYSTNIRIVKVRDEALFVWDGPSFDANPAGRSVPWTNHFMMMQGFYQPKVRARFQNGFSTGLYIWSCLQAQIDVEASNMLNLVESGSNGYGVQDVCSAQTTGRIRATDTRHAYTTGTNDSVANDGAHRYGRTYGQIIDGGTAFGSSAAGFDYHSESRNGTMYGVRTNGSRWGQTSSGSGLQLRGYRNVLFGCGSQGDAIGAKFGSQHAGDGKNNSLVLFDYYGRGEAVRIKPEAGATVTGALINGGRWLTSHVTVLEAYSGSDAVIEGVDITMTGTAGGNVFDLLGNVSLTIRDCTIDLSGATGTWHIARFTGAGNSVVIERCRVIGTFAAWLNGNGATGTASLRDLPTDTTAAVNAAGLTFTTVATGSWNGTAWA